MHNEKCFFTITSFKNDFNGVCRIYLQKGLGGHATKTDCIDDPIKGYCGYLDL